MTAVDDRPAIGDNLPPLDALELHHQAGAAVAELARRIDRAKIVAANMRYQLATLSAGEGRFATGLAYGDGAIQRILAALDGETDEAKLAFRGIIPLTPPTPEQLTMPGVVL